MSSPLYFDGNSVAGYTMLAAAAARSAFLPMASRHKKASPAIPDRMRVQWVPQATDRTLIKQTDELRCGPACAEMLFADRGVLVGQSVIATGLRLPTNGTHLAEAMNRAFGGLRWRGGSIDESASPLLVANLCTAGSWAALLEPSGVNHVGHWVVVDAVDVERAVIVVRDPIGLAFGVPIVAFTALWRFTALIVEQKR